MHVLLTEARFGDADALAHRLRSLGCRVSRCHERSGICRALAPGGHCPLDREDVDLLVDVRSPLAELTAREYGTVCAVRAKVPVAVVSTTGDVPIVPPGLDAFATATTEQRLLDTCAARLSIAGRS